MARSDEVRLAQYLIRKRWCSLRQVNRALDTQSRLRQESKVRPLGSILVQEQSLDEERLKVALSELGALRLSCSNCKKGAIISKYDPQNSYHCPICESELILEEEYSSGDSFFNKSPENRRFHDSGDYSTAIDLDARSADLEGEGEDPIIGKVIGGCQILSHIARGGMGSVYKARQLKLGRPVAVKVLSEELARDRKYVHRFLQEARSAAELNHGNVVHIIDFGEVTGIFYIIMEFVDGSNLREILEKERRLPPERILGITLQASQALRHAHQRGIIHRDIKPENIMLTRDGIVKLADLGLAKKVLPDQQDGGITNTRAIMGTPYYMAPEQVKDFRQVDRRTDIYSLGVTLFRGLSGEVPFSGRTPVEVMLRVVEGKRPTLRSLRPEIPPEVETLVDKMMARAPEDRHQDFGEVIAELEKVLHRLRERQREPDTVT